MHMTELGLVALRLHRIPPFDELLYDEQRRFLGLPDVGRISEDPDRRFGMKIYDRTGRPMSMAVWGQLCADFEYKVVEKTQVDIHGETVEVSTVWLGLDHGFMSEEPIIFETMVFGEVDGHDMTEMMQERYATEAEAREGHALAVAACRTLGSIEPDPEQGELQA